MHFALDASTHVSFRGDRYLHASVLHTFSGDSPPPLQLQARARQFSSYILLLGKIAAADVFEPTAAIIVKDKDDLMIPLLLETMPSPKAFRDAVESMSPEQQRFCKAFRGMQLASTLFGVVVIQIKPQLEKLLNLPYGSLTKEIQLTRQLTEMFVVYQIPADLVSYAGDESASGSEKLALVKDHVSAVRAMLDEAREQELEQTKQEAAKKRMEEEALWAEERAADEWKRTQQEQEHNLARIQEQIEEVKNIMNHNIDQALHRDAALDCLEANTTMSTSAMAFTSSAKRLKPRSFFGSVASGAAKRMLKHMTTPAPAPAPAPAPTPTPAPAPAAPTPPPAVVATLAPVYQRLYLTCQQLHAQKHPQK